MQGKYLEGEQMKAALYADAYSYDPPADLKQRIDAQIARQKKEVIYMRKMSVKKVAIVAAAVCALTGTVCMAAGKVSMYVGSTQVGTETRSFADVAKLEKQLGVAAYAKEGFENGYAFTDASIADFDALDENGNVVGNTKQLDINYTKGDDRVNYSIQNKACKISEEELAHAQVIEQDGMTYYYLQSHYLFLPTDGEPTEEELAAEEAGTLYISYGSDTREEKTYDSLIWNANGQGYSLAGFDTDLTVQDMLGMAAQLK